MGSKLRKAKPALGLNTCLYVPQNREESPPASNDAATSVLSDAVSSSSLLSPMGAEEEEKQTTGHLGRGGPAPPLVEASSQDRFVRDKSKSSSPISIVSNFWKKSATLEVTQHWRTKQTPTYSVGAGQSWALSVCRGFGIGMWVATGAYGEGEGDDFEGALGGDGD
ncbi:hypothetical protein C1H46_039515 [Malus baccata]|uniref:Uncharacterized protein n=1 Tax=Malus baccata TaxID=106549 RepID=A0A540KL58_MALBA|nr:hypothetical protein C1H46_039515 [Malus baccata]